MAFVYESPASEWVKNRYDWTSIPLLYTGEAGSFCCEPWRASVDKERDVIFFTGGGGLGRTSGEFQAYTHILFWKNTAIRCEIEIQTIYEGNDYGHILAEIYKLKKIYLPKNLCSNLEELWAIFSDLCLVDESLSFINGTRSFKPNTSAIEEI